MSTGQGGAKWSLGGASEGGVSLRGERPLTCKKKPEYLPGWTLWGEAGSMEVGHHPNYI